MYVPHVNALDDEPTIRAMVAEIGSAQLVTTGADGYPLATLLPVVWRGDTVIAHFARANDHWKAIGADQPALLVVTGPQAYISPTWYAAKAEHGRVVPTWNYSVVQLTGRATVHDDVEWLEGALDELVEHHEGHREAPWHRTDAPERYISGQLRAIVGLEFAVERVEGKAKLSQNRSDADRAGVIAGLDAETSPDAHAVAEQMRTGVLHRG
ncbi:FMN-binding negative transcriptional regulator [Phycicoccus sp. Soil803]|uniref:FMN-binding negative transcriptional regulator n=1 Tax=Phycicoccus sp. Soil803 TaxID=1736415 RepID=UPI00070A525F|nr:FMN-binding negative transcriptional regulator [Phycicoccus sp. Soil803]KRF23433.1 transcriptional regulator [Phycicoccus sp. Soil803]